MLISTKLIKLGIANRIVTINSLLIQNTAKQYSSTTVDTSTLDWDPSVGVEAAFTPPSKWYNSQEIFDLEKETVFKNTWLCGGRTQQVQSPSQFFTGTIADEPFVVARTEKNELKSFLNVCKHHGAIIMEGEGKACQFECPYHGWTYNLDGRLIKATKLKGIKDFRASKIKLSSIESTDTFDPFVFLKINQQNSEIANNSSNDGDDNNSSFNSFIGDLPEQLHATNLSDLQFLTRRSYNLKCNWKVFVDNYLDGGYHVPHAHKSLAGNLDLSSYECTLYDNYSIQRSAGTRDDPRIGESAFYAFLYPNFMINRYGPWMDTNTVWPISPTECVVEFDYYLHKDYLVEKNEQGSSSDSSDSDDDDNSFAESEFIRKSLAASDVVQQEDVYLCESVQKGLTSSAYDKGRYAPSVEYPMFHFHQLLYKAFTKS